MNGSLAARYAAFAGVSVASNIAAQHLALHLYSGKYALATAICTGTVVGLIVKYVLDKYFIFADFSAGQLAQGHQFFRYALTGIGTTLVFRMAEWIGLHVTGTTLGRDCGAVVGLTIGYVIKFYLDRQFVFFASGTR